MFKYVTLIIMNIEIRRRSYRLVNSKKDNRNYRMKKNIWMFSVKDKSFIGNNEGPRILFYISFSDNRIHVLVWYWCYPNSWVNISIIFGKSKFEGRFFRPDSYLALGAYQKKQKNKSKKYEASNVLQICHKKSVTKVFFLF